MIDVLDEEENVIGRKNIRDAHASYDLHKAVNVWIKNGDKILLQLRGHNLKFFPGLYDCAVSGHVDSGETGIEAAIREAQEEIGIVLEKEELKLLFKSKIYEYENYEIRECYLVEKNIDINKCNVPNKEIDELKWVDFSDLLLLMNKDSFLNYTDVYKDTLIKNINEKSNQ